MNTYEIRTSSPLPRFAGYLTYGYDMWAPSIAWATDWWRRQIRNHGDSVTIRRVQ